MIETLRHQIVGPKCFGSEMSVYLQQCRPT